MLLLFLAYLGGVLTIVSPCILPVLPFVFARSDQPIRGRTFRIEFLAPGVRAYSFTFG